MCCVMAFFSLIHAEPAQLSVRESEGGKKGEKTKQPYDCYRPVGRGVNRQILSQKALTYTFNASLHFKNIEIGLGDMA